MTHWGIEQAASGAGGTPVTGSEPAMNMLAQPAPHKIADDNKIRQPRESITPS
jgi:hypothetical protein